MPEDWPVRRGKLLFKERRDRSLCGEEELLTVSHITGVTSRSDKDVNMFLAESMEGYKLVSPGDVVINTMWAWMGAMGVSLLDGLISPSYNVYGPITDDFDPTYLDLLLRSRPFVAEVNRRSKGVWSSRLRLYPDAFLDIWFPVPSRDAQRAILEALEAAMCRERLLADLSRRSLDRLREFRSALITAAVSGEIELATWRKRGETDRRVDRIEELAPLREARA
ncbi:MAG: restriction endonuclease subunit S [Methyloceanibacter sp.]